MSGMEGVAVGLTGVLRGIGAVGAALWQRGWVEASGGNISVDVTGLAGVPVVEDEEVEGQERVELEGELGELAGRWYAVTAGGSRLRELGPGTIAVVRVAGDGRGYWRGAVGPTSELESHLGVHAIYRRRGWERTAVVHAHPTELVALTHMKRFQSGEALTGLLWRMHTEVAMVAREGVGFVPFAVPGTAAMGRATVAAAGERSVVVWEKHGCLAVGRSVGEAFDVVEAVNKGAAVYLAARGAGEEPEGLGEGALGAIREAYPPEAGGSKSEIRNSKSETRLK